MESRFDQVDEQPELNAGPKDDEKDENRGNGQTDSEGKDSREWDDQDNK